MDDDQTTDECIVRHVLEGNTRAFEQLVLRHQGKVSGFIFKIINDHHDREEVCQDVFLKAYMSIGQFRFEAKFSTWLLQIAYRTAISATRKKKLPTQESVDDPIDQQPDPIERQQIRELLQSEMNKLKLEERSVMTLHYLQELSIDDISTIIDRPAGTVKSLLYRSREKLQTSLTRQAVQLQEVI